ncbi:MAG: pentapeptide repeat-containing protein [Nitrospira sp.]|jgi:uncharacterized protein YjbI with pentapeptide repeats|nr:pentapeptide repeat-containing protein [Nitrospira sp.]
MANPEHLSLLIRSVADWNQWRRDNPDIQPDLTKADLREARLRGATLIKADLSGVNLRWAPLGGADLGGAILRGADCRWAYLRGATLVETDLRGARLGGANLRGATLINAELGGAHLGGVNFRGAHLGETDLTEANLSGADLTEANLSGADLAGATLERSILVNTTCNKAIFTGCRIHGISAWGLRLQEAQQTDLIITPRGEPDITVDNLEVAQFIYLLLNNQRIRHVIDTITSKVVLILGRFTPERKVVLDALRNELRHHNLTPVLFDFAIPADRDITETVTLLARMARFIVADLTDPASIPMELQAIAPDLAVPICSLIHKNQEPFSMFGTLKKYHWVLPPYRYSNTDELLANLRGKVIAPAEQKFSELKKSR